MQADRPTRQAGRQTTTRKKKNPIIRCKTRPVREDLNEIDRNRRYTHTHTHKTHEKFDSIFQKKEQRNIRKKRSRWEKRQGKTNDQKKKEPMEKKI
jgi:hypothetical protein